MDVECSVVHPDNNIRGSGGCSSVDDEDCGSGSGENMVNGGEAGRYILFLLLG